MNVGREQMLAELLTDVRAALGDRKLRTHDDKAAAIVELVADLLDPAAVAALVVPSARITVETIELGNATIEIDANGDLGRVQMSAPAELEVFERQE